MEMPLLIHLIVNISERGASGQQRGARSCGIHKEARIHWTLFDRERCLHPLFQYGFRGWKTMEKAQQSEEEGEVEKASQGPGCLTVICIHM